MSEYTHDDVSYSAQLAAELERQRRQQLEAERRRREEEERRRREAEDRRRREEEERKRLQEMADEKARGSWASQLETLARRASAAAEEDAKRNAGRSRTATQAHRTATSAAALPGLVAELRKALESAPSDLPLESVEVLERARRVAAAVLKGKTDPIHHRQCVEAALAELAELPETARRQRQIEERRCRELSHKAAGLGARAAVIEANSPLRSLAKRATELRAHLDAGFADAVAGRGTARLDDVERDLASLEGAFEAVHSKSFRRKRLTGAVLRVLEDLGYEATALAASEGETEGAEVRLLRDVRSSLTVEARFGLDGSMTFDALDNTDAEAVRRWCSARGQALDEAGQIGLTIHNRQRLELGHQHAEAVRDQRRRRRERPKEKRQ
jgi:hypothetical protein